MKLIYAYNENGIYFLFRGTLWWFNGKRVEKWCCCPYFHEIFVYDNKLYGIKWNNIYIFENKIFQYSYALLQTLFKTRDDYIHPSRICFNAQNYYNYSDLGGPFTRNGKPLPNKNNSNFGFKLLYYDGFLYFFSGHKNGINEKFDIQKNQWSLFSNQAIETINDINLMNELFYILFQNGKIGTYNSKTDTWHLLNITLPLSF